MHYAIKQSDVYIQFLQAHQLCNVIKYLQELAHSFGIDKDKISSTNDTKYFEEEEV